MKNLTNVKYFKIGVKYGHVGGGKCIEAYLPVVAKDLTRAIMRAQTIGGIKKDFLHIWMAVEITDPFELLDLRDKWRKLKMQMRERLRVKKLRKKAG